MDVDDRDLPDRPLEESPMNADDPSSPRGGKTLEPCIAQLRSRFGDRLQTGRAIREQHGKDVSFHPCLPPDAVLFVLDAADVRDAMRICAAHRCPVIAFGTGTSCEGHVGAPHGGLCIDFSRMDRVLAIDADNLHATVQPGVTRKALNRALNGTGLHFPIDPGADASLGGMVGTRASGTNAVRYGTMRDNVLALQVVMADGRLLRTGTLARKSSAGYDLTRLIVGSEGTLALVTEVTVRLHPLPQAVVAASCRFPTLADAVGCVIDVMRSGVGIGRVELLDEVQIDAVNRYSKLGLPEEPTLFFEFSGEPRTVDAQMELVRELAAERGAGGFDRADTPEARTRLWQARHDILWANLALKPGSQGLPTDVCVPIPALAEQIIAARRDVEAAGLIAPVCGHVGDGNFHLCFVVDPDDADEMRRVDEVNDRMVRRAIAAGGTCTGEHGIGLGKREYLRLEAGGGVDVMRSIKQALDPLGILNPGKVV